MSYVCSVCGYKAIKPLGKCPNCGEWDTFVREGEFKGKRKFEVKKLKDVELGEGFRIDTGISILNSVLGGGIFKGSVILLGGKPGVGKSTLFLQIANYLSRMGYRVLFVSAEESVYQVRQRAERLKVDSDIDITEEANLDTVLENAGNYDVLFVDSIQAVYTEDISSPPGSISQVRFCADKLFKFAKERGVSILISGHITKSGIIAGPKTLEHTVDVVLYLEGDKGGMLRMLRAEKNRFGPTDEVGFFTMEERGLFPVEDPSLYFYKPPEIPKVGLSYTVMMKGNVPIVLEIQSLVHYSYYPVPTRHSVGYDPRRLAIILALLEKVLNFKFAKMDVYVNVGGGIKVDDPFADMAVCAAIISSAKNIPFDNLGLFVGEISLTGDFRAPVNLEVREREGQRLGFKRLYSPAGGKFLELVKVGSLRDLTIF